MQSKNSFLATISLCLSAVSLSAPPAGPFKVTVAAQQIVQLMTRTIQEAQATGSTAVVQSMSNALVEMAALFIAVPDSRLKQQIAQVSRIQTQQSSVECILSFCASHIAVEQIESPTDSVVRVLCQQQSFPQLFCLRSACVRLYLTYVYSPTRHTDKC